MNTICLAIANMGINCEVFEASPSQLETNFNSHIAAYGLSFGTQEEYDFRFQLWSVTDQEINEINSDANNTFKVGHNFFSTLTDAERKKYLGKRLEGEISSAKIVALDESTI